MNQDQLPLSIVIPAYNEGKRLPRTLEIIDTYFCQLQKPYEILVVNDGSVDDTAELVQNLLVGIPVLRLISYSPNRGKGFAIKMGMREAKGRFILFSDADLSTPIAEFDKFLTHLESGAAVVIGTRKHKDALIVRRQPQWRESMGKVFTGISNLILGLHATDFTCGFKAFRQDAAHQIFGFQEIERWAFDSEILFLARRLNYPVVEVPVEWVNSPDTKVRIVRDTITSFAALFKIRWNAATGRYRNKTQLEAVPGGGKR